MLEPGMAFIDTLFFCFLFVLQGGGVYTIGSTVNLQGSGVYFNKAYGLNVRSIATPSVQSCL